MDNANACTVVLTNIHSGARYPLNPYPLRYTASISLPEWCAAVPHSKGPMHWRLFPLHLTYNKSGRSDRSMHPIKYWTSSAIRPSSHDRRICVEQFPLLTTNRHRTGQKWDRKGSDGSTMPGQNSRRKWARKWHQAFALPHSRTLFHARMFPICFALNLPCKGAMCVSFSGE